MRSTITHDTEEYRLTCYGGGTSYVLVHKASDEFVHVQGDDAVQFEEEFASLEEFNPDEPTNRLLAEMFHQYTP